MNKAAPFVTDAEPIASAAPCLLTRNGDTAPRWQPGERLHHLFEAVVDRQPDAIAVEATDRVLTFAQLEAEATRLATRLQARGYGPGDVIALLFGRSIEAYVALLAVLKIHAAYVPLDPAFPADRVSYIAEDAGATAVLTLAEHAALAGAAELPVIRLDAREAPEPPADFAPPRRRPAKGCDELAYIIYTSGSTGRPKGVRIEHRSIVNFVRVATETYGYRPGDRVYQGLTLAFDFSVEEIWVPLLAGATLVPSCSRASLVGADLHAFLSTRRITALCCVPTLLATLEDELPLLRLLIVSGEACPEEIVRRWHREGRTILNAYGPTETTVTATTAILAPGEPVTLGTPLPSYSVVILDPDAPVALPQGAVGEIGIAGIGLSPGYVGRDDLTARAFVPDFLGLRDNPCGRIYRTGDLGRINQAGLLDYLGRIDTQVKIRGYRIELTEIESLLMQQPGIVQAVVDICEPEPGMVELVAYYTASAPVPPERLAGALEKALPSYMLPAYYEPVAAFAMLPSDKVDRKALPAPSGPRLVRQTGRFVPPATDTEAALAAMLADLLKLERVSVEDDFFADLGANSLLMARFSTRIRARFDTAAVSMREIYEAPTVRSLAARLGEATDAGADAAAAPEPAEAPAVHEASTLAYWGTGLYQLFAALALAWAAVAFAERGLGWLAAAPDIPAFYARSVLLSAAAFVTLALLPVAAKWLLIGRWRETVFPIWSVAYARFWTVRTLTQISPLAFMPGTPLYIAYLKVLGARVDWSAMVLCRPPVCTDLIEIGRGAVVGREVTSLGYKAVAGRIVTGPVSIGTDAYVGDGAVLDIGTRIEAGAELGHASALHTGQTAAAGLSYAGCPATLTSTRFRTLPPGKLSLARRLGFTLAQIGFLVLVAGPVSFLVLAAAASLYTGSVVQTTGLAASVAALPSLLGITALAFFGLKLVDLARVMILPRLAWLFLREERTYRLFGLRHFMLQAIVRNSNSRFFNLLFGDSSYVVHYLRSVGYRFPNLKQTGSNFGVNQRHDVPFLCEFGSGTMVSDNLVMANADFSNAAFRLGWVRFGEDNFVGNDIFYPARGRTGSNVLFGTRAMVPVDGPVRENTGLLGAPVFEIPRSVHRDHRFDHLKRPEVLAERLRMKNRYNLRTMGLFLLARYGLIATEMGAAHLLWAGLGLTSAFWMAVEILVMLSIGIAGAVALERASYRFGRHEPHYCSIYDPYFWRHERFWKLNMSLLLTVLNGTPFKPLVWRGLGVRIGRKVFDDGCAIVEKSLVAIGDYCTLNTMTTIQAHSLEDGTFKSDRILLGRGVTLDVRAFLHYGTALGDGALVEPASFLMKGEAAAEGSRWGGNPARPITRVASSAPTASSPGGADGEREDVGLAIQP